MTIVPILLLGIGIHAASKNKCWNAYDGTCEPDGPYFPIHWTYPVPYKRGTVNANYYENKAPGNTRQPTADEDYNDFIRRFAKSNMPGRRGIPTLPNFCADKNGNKRGVVNVNYHEKVINPNGSPSPSPSPPPSPLPIGRPNYLLPRPSITEEERLDQPGIDEENNYDFLFGGNFDEGK